MIREPAGLWSWPYSRARSASRWMGYCLQQAGALRLILDGLGIENRLVVGSGRFPSAVVHGMLEPPSSGGHAWLRVTIAGDEKEVSMNTERTLLPTGVTVEYELVGPPGAPVLCFVHGLGAAMEQFQPQVEHFSGHYRVLRLSHRGHGRSGEPPTAEAEAYTPRALAEDLRALVEHLGIEEIHFVGNSLGGLVGYELLNSRQPRIQSLTTFGTTAELHTPKVKYWMLVGLIRLFGMLFGNNAMGTLLEKSGSKDREVGRTLKKMFLYARQDALTMLTRSIADYDYTPVLSATNVPVLLIRGELDKEINATLSSTLAAIDQLPNGRVVSLADAGHFANMELPDEFNRVLAAFLREVPSC